MNKSIITALVALVLLGAAYFAYDSMLKNDTAKSTSEQSQNFDSDNTTTQPASTPNTEVKSGRTTSLSQLSKQGAQVCDITITPKDSKLSFKGKYYTDGTGKFRSEIQSGPNGEIYYLLVDKQMFYNWNNQGGQGFTRKVEATTDAEYDAAINENDLSQTYDFNCAKWQVDSSVLTPPANIEFVDMSSSQTNPYQ